jgi:hypothetical protein
VNNLTETAVRIATRSVSRVEIRVNERYEVFRARYEAAAPPFEPERVAVLATSGAPWSDYLSSAAENAPYDFMIYWSIAGEDILAAAGDGGKCTEYLMGNHTIAEQMYRHHPGALMFAPLRTTIYETAAGETFFAIDRPSDTVKVLGDKDIDEVGIALDRKVARLLQILGIAVPDSLI